MKEIKTIRLQGRMVGLFANITEMLLGNLPNDGPPGDDELILRRRWDLIRQQFMNQNISVNTSAELVMVGWPRAIGGLFHVAEHQSYDTVIGYEDGIQPPLRSFGLGAYGGNVIPVITKFPDGMSEELKTALRVVFEQRPRTISGLKSELTINSNAGNLGVSTMLSGHPVVEIVEGDGYLVRNTLTEYARLHVAGKSEQELADNGLSIMFIEADRTHTRVTNAWHYFGVWFERIEVTGRRAVHEKPELVNYQIQLKGMHETKPETVLAQAEGILRGLNASALDYSEHALDVLREIGKKAWEQHGDGKKE